MRNGRALVLAVAVLLAGAVGIAGPALADEACKNPDALGVSRVQVIDSTAASGIGPVDFRRSGAFLGPKEVVLTFDDGPFPGTTPDILAALAEQCTKATFFYVGKMALRYPDILAEVDRAGHTIAAHTWGHANLRKLTPGRAQVEIEKGVSMLEARLGHPIAPFFRFPYLDGPKFARKYLAGRDFTVFSTDVDSWDSHGLTPSVRIVKYVMTRLKEQGRGIVLMHDIKHTTASALPEILKQLKAEGYKIVHMVPKAPAMSLAAFNGWAKKMIDHEDGGVAVASSDEPVPPDPANIAADAVSEPDHPAAGKRSKRNGGLVVAAISEQALAEQYAERAAGAHLPTPAPIIVAALQAPDPAPSKSAEAAAAPTQVPATAAPALLALRPTVVALLQQPAPTTAPAAKPTPVATIAGTSAKPPEASAAAVAMIKSPQPAKPSINIATPPVQIPVAPKPTAVAQFSTPLPATIETTKQTPSNFAPLALTKIPGPVAATASIAKPAEPDKLKALATPIVVAQLQPQRPAAIEAAKPAPIATAPELASKLPVRPVTTWPPTKLAEPDKPKPVIAQPMAVALAATPEPAKPLVVAQLQQLFSPTGTAKPAIMAKAPEAPSKPATTSAVPLVAAKPVQLANSASAGAEPAAVSVLPAVAAPVLAPIAPKATQVAQLQLPTPTALVTTKVATVPPPAAVPAIAPSLSKPVVVAQLPAPETTVATSDKPVTTAKAPIMIATSSTAAKPTTSGQPFSVSPSRAAETPTVAAQLKPPISALYPAQIPLQPANTNQSSIPAKPATSPVDAAALHKPTQSATPAVPVEASKAVEVAVTKPLETTKLRARGDNAKAATTTSPAAAPGKVKSPVTQPLVVAALPPPRRDRTILRPLIPAKPTHPLLQASLPAPTPDPTPQAQAAQPAPAKPTKRLTVAAADPVRKPKSLRPLKTAPAWVAVNDVPGAGASMFLKR